MGMVLTKAKILIVDDEADFLNTCSRLLARLGFECITAPDGPRAFQLIERERPDLVVTDLSLPVGDGFQVARCARTGVPSIPVIIVTAYHTPQIAKKAREEGAAAYLPKPFSNRELSDAVFYALTEPSAE